MGQLRTERHFGREQEIKILEALDRIERSGLLGAGDRMPALLRFIVTEELAGRGHVLKSAVIATDVLGRGKNFDPQTDSIVRAEMARLRKSLELYNATLGTKDAVLLTIPKGSYRPVITSTHDVPPQPTATPSLARRAATGFDPLSAAFGIAAFLAIGGLIYAALGWNKAPPGKPAASLPPMLVIHPETRDATPHAARLAQALQLQVSDELARLPWLTVIQPTRLGDIEVHLADAVKARPVYMLDVRLGELDQGYRVTTILKRWPEQSVRWSASHDHRFLSDHVNQSLRDIAAQIANDIATPGGAITRAEIIRIDGHAREDNRFLCLMNLRLYWRSYDPALRRDAEACLTATLAVDPDFETGHAALAFLKIESARLERGTARAQLLTDAGAQLAKITAPTVESDEARLALAACTGDVPTAQGAATRLVATYPNNPDVLADVGSKTGLFLGQWDTALAMEERAMLLNPAPDPWYPLATIVRALLDGEPRKAAFLLAKVPQRAFHTGQIVRLAVAGKTGARNLISDAKAQLKSLGLTETQAMIDAIDGECWSEETKQVVRRGLRVAMD